ncbi:hypothetical protein AGABI2DRAFT_148368 [Agaricus bisporus var. bisporus H97]|uniref:hypothetical protein n=1 Tax=Agaricus bisporus var. bisporus (strain H97 / ATCC MYA-4626 / FGSC 10389) TaxID=936046 RepID=UPI00029F7121|nr:hypothetical protein AGABI2DRAFT_148368 [Agaricus bisporus var. bisporus H97]EKV49788.1 hypothetical protein AGABI2DRAFT_148368 [Agaricus bisporus var. bisporus H97]
MYQLLSSMPRSQLSSLQRRIAPLLQFDVVGSLPSEVALQIFSHLPPFTLLTCAAVCRRWNAVANDQSLWKALCHARGWEWRQPVSPSNPDSQRGLFKEQPAGIQQPVDDDDEGMGDSDDEGAAGNGVEDSGFASFSMTSSPPSASSSPYKPTASTSRPRRKTTSYHRSNPVSQIRRSRSEHDRHSAPASLAATLYDLQPDYKLLFRTHIHLRNRYLTSSYRLSVIQTRGSPSNGHANMIYCVQLYTYPQTNKQVIFTGSRDKTVREWNLKTGEVERVFEGEHTESVLSLCVKDGWMVSAGSDWRVVVWNLDRSKNGAVKVLRDHSDSVLCVRLDDQKLVSCSKDRTVRVYTFPGLDLLHVLGGHRAAVNAISLSNGLLVSGSGDRSMNVWDVKTGKLLRTFEDHHTRGIASIDFKSPYIVSGSSDKHIRLVDMNTSRGWSTSSEYDTLPLGLGLGDSSPSLPTAGHSAGGEESSISDSYPGGRKQGLVTCMCQSCGSVEVQPIGCATPNSSSASTSISAFSNLPLGFASPFYSSSFPHNRHSQPSTSSAYHHPNFHSNLRALSTPNNNNNNITTTGTHHTNLVRSVILGPEFIITGSYDLSIKIWCRQTGKLMSNLTGGHIGKIFCVAADRTKVVSCGEDMRICVWDFGVDVEVGFVKTEW